MDLGIKLPDENLSIDAAEAWFKNIPQQEQYAVWRHYFDLWHNVRETIGTPEHALILARYGEQAARKANQRVTRYYKYIDPKGIAECTSQFDV